MAIKADLENYETDFCTAERFCKALQSAAALEQKPRWNNVVAYSVAWTTTIIKIPSSTWAAKGKNVLCRYTIQNVYNKNTTVFDAECMGKNI